MKNKLSLTFLLNVLFIIVSFAQSATPNSIFQQIVQKNYTEVIVETDFDGLIANKVEGVEQKAVLIFSNDQGEFSNFSVKLKARGVFRKQFCDLPPLRLNFDKEDLEAMDLNPEFDKLKLVTHCKDNPDSEQALLKEYWAYKLYNEITPASFKVHLLKITYINIKDRSETAENFAFLIENNKELANRLAGEKIDQLGLTAAQVDKETHQNTMVFNYMIGNLDWLLRKQRNIKLIKSTQKDKLIVVPYDFDLSAFVRPSYARLNADFNQTNIEDRYCVGRFDNEQELMATLANFKDVKENMLNNLKESTHLKKSNKRKLSNYIKSFFTSLEDKTTMKQAFLREEKYSYQTPQMGQK